MRDGLPVLATYDGWMALPSLPDTFSLSSDVFKYWIFDYSKLHIKIIFQDGREVTAAMSGEVQTLSSEIAASTFDWEKWWVISQTKRGHLIIAEAYSPETADPLHGRPSVYLDQNHWSTLAKTIFDPSSIKESSERKAAQELIHLANDGGIVLPVSSANLRETANLYGDQRYEVGAAIASLSGGWQLRHPLAVWRAEMVRLLAEMNSVPVPEHSRLPVVTLEPHAFLDGDVRAHAMASDEVELFILAISSPGVILEVLLDPQQSERSDPDSWVSSNKEFSNQLATSNYTKYQKQQAAYARAWEENRSLVQTALKVLNLDESEQSSVPKPKDIQGYFARMPALGLFTKLMVMRQINASHKWRANDLTDLIFLSCASGYTDYVAAEKHTGTQLRQFQRTVSTGTKVHTKLETLVRQIRADGVKTDGEIERGS